MQVVVGADRVDVFDNVGVVQSLHQFDLRLNGTQRVVVDGGQWEPFHCDKVARFHVESLVHDGKPTTTYLCAKLLGKMGGGVGGIEGGEMGVRCGNSMDNHVHKC